MPTVDLAGGQRQWSPGSIFLASRNYIYMGREQSPSSVIVAVGGDCSISKLFYGHVFPLTPPRYPHTERRTLKSRRVVPRRGLGALPRPVRSIA